MICDPPLRWINRSEKNFSGNRGVFIDSLQGGFLMPLPWVALGLLVLKSLIATSLKMSEAIVDAGN